MPYVRVYLEEQNTKSGDTPACNSEYHHSLSLSWQLRLPPLYLIVGVSSICPTLLRTLELDNATHFLKYCLLPLGLFCLFGQEVSHVTRRLSRAGMSDFLSIASSSGGVRTW